MQNIFVLALLVAGPLVACIAIIRMPSWFARSLHTQRMWLLRDAVIDDVQAGRLPAEHPAVKQLLARIRSCIKHADRMTLLDLYVFKWAMRPVSPATRGALAKEAARCELRGLDAEQRGLIGTHWQKLGTLVAGSVLLGSWLGIFRILTMIPAAFRVAREEEAAGAVDHGPLIRIEIEARQSARAATDLAATSRFGQLITELAEQKRGMLITH